MISKRYKRPAKPQENLRQFALNNSKGVDGTKSPTDFDTISRSNNLVVNPDGSMSLRKPITYVENSLRISDTRQFYLYDGKHKLEVNGNDFCITDENGDEVPVKVTYTGPTGITQSISYEKPECTVTALVFPNDGSIEVVNLNSATIVGNCDVDLSKFGDSAVDFTLYDGDVTRLPRYVQVYYAETDKIWTVAVKTPEINVLTTSDDGPVLNPNLTLDNPYAIRDTYDSVIPSIKGILAYTSSEVVNGTTQPSLPQYSQTESVPLSGALGHYFEHKDIPFTAHRTYSESKTLNDESSMHATVEYEFYVSSANEANNYKHRCTVHQNLLLKDESLQGDTLVAVDVVFSVELWYRITMGGNLTPEQMRHLDPVSFHRVYTAEDLRAGVSLECTKVTDFSPSTSTMAAACSVDVVFATVPLDEALLKVSDITESNKATRHRVLNAIAKNTTQPVVLKAFCNLPPKPDPATTHQTYYAMWFKSTDSITWEPLDSFNAASGVFVRELSPDWTSSEDVKTPSKADYTSELYYPLAAVSEQDRTFTIVPGINGGLTYLVSRIDAVPMSTLNGSVPNMQYRFKIVAVESITSNDVEWDDSDNAPDVQYRVYATVAQRDYTPVFKSEFEFLETEFGNTVYGKKLYHKKSIYSYGSEKFFNNIFVSDIDSFITPLYNVIDLDTYAASQANCLVPWRDYLVSATGNAIYLHTRQDGGFLTKTVNTSIGISAEDARCCKAVLNGILFKAGPKVYQLYPNVYSGDDSTLNLTEISRAVEDYLEEYEPVEHLPFAFSTESEYILMLPRVADTICLRYDYSSKLWTVCTYPIVATDYKLMNIDDIRIFGICGDVSAEFKFDSVPSGEVYGDVTPDGVRPIAFEWDTGQKTDNISVAKQFVESKLVFATEDTPEAFPMSLVVAIDGDPHITTLDVSSDAPFWRTDDSVGALNTSIRLGDSDDVGVFRQLIVRYSGKGRSVRHILSGSPTSNFRLYETYVRYKTLNIKR